MIQALFMTLLQYSIKSGLAYLDQTHIKFLNVVQNVTAKTQRLFILLQSNDQKYHGGKIETTKPLSHYCASSILQCPDNNIMY